MDESQALKLQEEMRQRVRVDVPLKGQPRLVAGTDVAYEAGTDRIAAAIAVLDASTLEVVEIATAAGVADFPYIPGLLGFREVPILLQALEKLSVTPDVFVCDGYGVAHPRRFGLACHFGVQTGFASFGVGKTAFVGTHGPVGQKRGDSADLVYEGDVVGRAVRTQKDVKPVFVSAGHLITLDEATDLTLMLAPRYRQPETTRRADRACRDALI